MNKTKYVLAFPALVLLVNFFLGSSSQVDLDKDTNEQHGIFSLISILGILGEFDLYKKPSG